ncbi:sensor histidine kinase [Sulfurimonas sp.]|uniref:sensor histidine kinase n=1 Tax=Sulfurimonas sp. TaxID=2022749 RepID=UPI0026055CB6|nr:HAMP domain-containing sensor histidine kinase [Sulfurimonas sp.]
MSIQENFFTSGWHFVDDDALKNRFQMMNIAIVLSSIAVLYGVFINFLVRDNHALGSFEFLLFCINICLLFLLRKDKQFYNLVSTLATTQFSILLILLVYISTPEDMKLLWFFTYPIVMLYMPKIKIFFVWFFFLIFMILLAPLQPFIAIHYTFFQLFYFTFVLVIVSIIVYFYKRRMEEAHSTILSQQNILKKQLEELKQKDKLLTIQSKQAVMGEMISMIAHQWRQPLSSVTLNISNFQVKRALNVKLSDEELDRVLNNISDTAVYLSDTINDFQTYFNPQKELKKIDVINLVKRVINFTLPRVKDTNIEIKIDVEKPIIITTYVNEIIQVLLNILNNAIDEFIAMKVQTPKVVVRILNEEDNVLIEVHDNAGGIDENNIESIFEPYFSTKGKNGTGLGLYMSQMIMQKQFHTHIEVFSKDGSTVFKIRVPKTLS